MANGRVCTGFSKPYYAMYNENGGTPLYTGGGILARGVEVTVNVEASADNKFHADNQTAESDAGRFQSGTVALTVDGLLDAARKAVFGLPTADASGWTAYGDEMNVPYVGIGFICRYMSGGGEAWVPTVIAKAQFTIPEKTAATQEEEIDWQTEQLEATIMRDDSESRNWKFEGKEYTSEALAEAALKTKLGIQ